MVSDIEGLIMAIHGSGTRAVIALTGGGSRALTDLLEVPGASRTLVEALIPYSGKALAAFLGGPPDQACCAATARAMAMVAFQRAGRYEGQWPQVIGLACTASLRTDRPKRGDHRAHLALQTLSATVSRSVVFLKGLRSRSEEEELVARLVLNLLAEGCHVSERLEVSLRPEEPLQEVVVEAPEAWQALMVGGRDLSPHHPPWDQKPESGIALFSGSFHPWHTGHARMAQIAREILGIPVHLELSILNVDKPPLDYYEIQQRLEPFPEDQCVWLTRAPTFEEKSRLFPNSTFLVGVDTLARIVQPRYYGNDPAARDQALEKIAARGCRFLVFGRCQGGRFLTLEDLELPETLRKICQGVGPEVFREDICSSDLRRKEAFPDEETS